jgi:hypothetical protein
MSGTGKSAALAELERRGHRVVDTDYGDWVDESGPERPWQEDLSEALLEEFEPRLRAGATEEIDMPAPLAEVVSELERIAAATQ